MEKNAALVSRLIYKYLAGELDETGWQMLHRWLDEEPGNRALFEKITGTENLKKGIRNEYLVRDSQEKVWNEIVQGVNQLDRSLTGTGKKLYRRGGSWMSYAAIVLLVSGVIGYAVMTGDEADRGKNRTGRVVVATQNEILPGTEKAVLTLSNGQEIALESGSAYTISDRGMSIGNSDGALTYGGSDQSVFNTMTTPKGGQYKLVFADGTRVWLNSASSITYPTAFTGSDRVVELRGQAYFEVSENRLQPFKVKANGVEVEVLGTHFDIMAYGDEASVNTTLVEGSVKVYNGHTAILKPGQQAIADNATRRLSLQEANIGAVIAWKNGLFEFNNISLEHILKEIARWYDVEIVNGTSKSGELYGGSISRQQKLSDVLELLALDSDYRFRIEERKVIVE